MEKSLPRKLEQKVTMDLDEPVEEDLTEAFNKFMSEIKRYSNC
jgi:hypothetical protein